MTHRATYQESGFRNQQAQAGSLIDAIKAHQAAEVASFHTPGHKGRFAGAGLEAAWQCDLTELPGLDELADAQGVLRQLQERCARLWGAAASFISTNGATGGLLAAIMACAPRGRKIVLPRNAHRSAIHALVLSGLEPIWYEPTWLSDWQIHGSVDVCSFQQQVSSGEVAAALVVSPTYAGVCSDIEALTSVCHNAGVPLIVDEAHGAHLVASAGPPHALAQRADMVVHSAHKTMAALTQTGLVHVGNLSLVPPEAVRAALNLVQSSSPSYLLMLSLERAVDQLCEGRTGVETALWFREAARGVGNFTVLNSEQADAACDALHVLVKPHAIPAQQFYDLCCEKGVYPEALLGKAVLFLFGSGTTATDADRLLETLDRLSCAGTIDLRAGSFSVESGCCPAEERSNETHASSEPNIVPASAFPSAFGEQALSPRQAFLSKCESVPSHKAVGRVAAECVAPCPPGTAVIVPGQRVTEEAVLLLKQTHVRVVVESGARRT